mmetsp:Transcript_10545/g.27922  ORF Transcript_10545/g.27922 Transcript_10545/m.27922 type:complete len:281 (-) Transcript_10545:128-970(-)
MTPSLPCCRNSFSSTEVASTTSTGGQHMPDTPAAMGTSPAQPPQTCHTAVDVVSALALLSGETSSFPVSASARKRTGTNIAPLLASSLHERKWACKSSTEANRLQTASKSAPNKPATRKVSTSVADLSSHLLTSPFTAEACGASKGMSGEAPKCCKMHVQATKWLMVSWAALPSNTNDLEKSATLATNRRISAGHLKAVSRAPPLAQGAAPYATAPLSAISSSPSKSNADQGKEDTSNLRSCLKWSPFAERPTRSLIVFRSTHASASLSPCCSELPRSQR